MEMIIGCIFLTVLIIILAILCKNVTLNVNITYPTPEYVEIKDPYNEEGDPENKDTVATIDDILKEVNSIMLGREEDSDE